MPDLIDRAIHLTRAQAALLVTTATGGPKIDTVQSDYEANRRQLRTLLSRLGIEDPFLWKNLWEWYEFYSGNFPSWAERRQYVASISGPLLEQLEHLKKNGAPTLPA